MKAGILIPCYNEEAYIGGVVQNTFHYAAEVIVVNDGSTDNTGKEAEEAGAVVLTNRNHRGKGEALAAGFKHILNRTDWDAVVIIDGDGQHDPAEIPAFLKTAEDNEFQIITGDRLTGVKMGGAMPVVRWLTNKFMSQVISVITGQKIPDSQCGYRLIKREVLNDLELVTSRFDTESEILIRAAQKGYRIGALPVKIIYRDETSYINPIRDTIRFAKLVYAAVFRTKKSHGRCSVGRSGYS